MTFYLPESMGWGNVVLCLSDLVFKTSEPRVYTSFHDVDRGFTLKGITVTDNEHEPHFDAHILINNYYRTCVHSNIKHFLQPTDELLALVKLHAHNAIYGMHIRRGAYSRDSENIGCHGLDENGDIKRAYFASDQAVQKFMHIVESTHEKFFIASDSTEIKKMFKEKYGDRIIIFDHEIALTYDCKTLQNKVNKKSRLDCYVDWYLLSMCKTIYITGGTPGKPEISTFGYSAGVYGGCNIAMIMNI